MLPRYCDLDSLTASHNVSEPPSSFVENKRRLQRRDFILVDQYEKQRERLIDEVIMPMQERRLVNISPEYRVPPPPDAGGMLLGLRVAYCSFVRLYRVQFDAQ